MAVKDAKDAASAGRRRRLTSGGAGALWMSLARTAAAVSVFFLAAGCSAIGPRKIEPDSLDYATAISRSLQQSMLLNIVKIHHGDSPSFIQITSIISQYSLEGRVEMSGEWSRGEKPTPILRGSSTYYDRPTITYTPVYGGEFLQTVMSPVDPTGVLLLAQSGLPVDILYGCSLDSINGLKNRPSLWTGQRSSLADPRFIRLLEIMATAQGSGIVSMRFEKSGDVTTPIVSIPLSVEGEHAEVLAETRALLGLDPETTDFKFLYGSVPSDKDEIVVRTRSILGMMTFLARTFSAPDDAEPEASAMSGAPIRMPKPLFDVKYSRDRPADAFVAVSYRGCWFYIDDRDRRSKATLSLLLYALSLAQGGAKGVSPMITVSTGG